MLVFYQGKPIRRYMKKDETSSSPVINFNDIIPGYYTLVMSDPDAVNGEYLHLLMTNINVNPGGDLLYTGDIVVPYQGPNPPPGTGTHHYIFRMLRQPGVYHPTRLTRSRFDLEAFINKNGLEEVDQAKFMVRS